ncbi:MAG: hypothetical protein CSA47_01605 [Gammaproteobacteria bacterium]|nr:MAG: hypothetical protein CSA47_01605 [Gammaproteobacteria bacterium]
MKLSLADFFSKGQFWSSLEKSLKALQSKSKAQGKRIKKLKENDVQLAGYIKFLQKENDDLKRRIERLEDKIYEIHTSQKPESLVIHSEEESMPNNKIQRMS